MNHALLIMYTIYKHPSDYPDEYVCRRWTAGRLVPIDTAEPFARAQTLEAVRAQLPRGLYRLNREAGDQPQVAETWI